MKITTNAFIVLFLFLFVVCMMPYIGGLPWDKSCWISWATAIDKYGISSIYNTDSNYPPLFHYLLWLYTKLAGSGKSIAENINYLRAFTLVFDFLGLWYVYKWLNKGTAFITILLFSILNIAYSYNTLIWGQFDGIFSALVFISVYYAWRNKMLVSLIFFVLALNFKLQSVVILPVLGLLFINNIWSSTSRMKGVVLPVVLVIAVQLVILIPFIASGMVHTMYSRVITAGSVDMYPVLTKGAANLWIFADISPFNKSDADMFIAGISYRNAGLLLFFLTSAIALVPLCRQIFQRRGSQPDRRIVLITGTLVYLLFFYFNTQMHERYCHPAFIFITAYAFFTKDFIGYCIFSIAYLLNLEKCMQTMQLNYKTLLFDFRFISSLFAIAIIYMGVKLYQVNKRAQSTHIV